MPKHSHNEIILRARQIVGIVIFQRNLSFSFFAETGENDVSRNLSIYRPFLEIFFVLLLIKSLQGMAIDHSIFSFFIL